MTSGARADKFVGQCSKPMWRRAAGGAGLGRDLLIRLRADRVVLWRALGRAQARLGRRWPEAGDEGQSSVRWITNDGL
jgi:hypothetical protein